MPGERRIREAAENGRTALAKLSHAPYDLVFLDYHMPEVNGLAVLRHIRLSQSSLLVVMMTSERASEVTAESLVALGARACLFKPFDLRDVDQVLECASVAVPSNSGGFERSA